MSTDANENGLTARPVKMHELLNESGAIFVVPDYQREYEWSQEQLSELWADIQSSVETESSHFLGQVILVDRGQNRYEIVDGQQRLTSISVLICALRDRYSHLSIEQFDSILDSCISTDNITTGEKQRRLQFSDHVADEKQYSAIHRGAFAEVSGNIADAYDFFSKRLSECGSDELDRIRQTVLRHLNLIRTEPGDLTSAYQVFQTENGRGKDLQPQDLMKSILFERAAKRSANAEHVKDLWIEMIDDISRIGRKKSPVTRPLYQSMMSAGLINAKGAGKTDVRDFGRVLDEYINSDGDVVGFVKMLRSEAAYQLAAYHQTLGSERFNIQFDRPSRTVGRLSRHCTYKCPNSGIALHALYKKIDDEERLVNCLRLLRILCVRLVLADTTGAKRRRPFYTVGRRILNGTDAADAIISVINEKTKSDTLLREIVARKQFKYRNKFTPMILLELETSYFSNNHSNISVGDFSIEHIAPRAAFSKDRYTEWRSELDFSADKFDNYSGRIGNLTILDSPQNQRAGTNPFEEKKREYRTSEYKMTKRLCEYDEWGFEQIDQRSEDLADLIVDRWSVDG